jgi:endonuclease YncB( thermonuclease family)
VTCEPNGKHWDSIVAVCFADGEDLGAWMASQGRAVDCDHFKPSY